MLEILKYLCTTKCLNKYQRLQFYLLYVLILDETPYKAAKCTVKWVHFKKVGSFLSKWVHFKEMGSFLTKWVHF